MRSSSLRNPLCALIGLILTGSLVTPVAAQVTAEGNIYYFTDAATINTDYGYSDVVIGKNPGGAFANANGDTDILTPYTVTIADGANILYNLDFSDGYGGVSAYNFTGVNVTGGTLYGVNGYDNTTIQVSGGSMHELGSHQNSTLTVTGGSITGAGSYDTSTFNLSSGGVFIATSNNASTTNITGGYAGSTYANNTSTMNLFTGGVGDVYGYHSSTTNIFDGTVSRAFGYANSTINISGGMISTITNYADSITNISAGTITDILGTDNSVFNITGGTIGANTIRLFGNSVVNLYGANLSFSSAGTGSDAYGTYTNYLLSGVLQGGQSISDVHLIDYDGGYGIGTPSAGAGNTGGNLRFISVSAIAAPEPGTLPLTIGVVLPFALSVRRRVVQGKGAR